MEFMECWHDIFADMDMFRGHLNEEWILRPSIVRYNNFIDGYSSIKFLEEELIGRFVQYSIPFKDYRRVNYLEKLIDGQHYGLPTRLLDWTSNPLKGLFFAVENPEFDDVDGTVFALAHRRWLEGTSKVKIENSLVAIYPEMFNERLIAQEGCFTSFLLPKEGFEVLELSIENYPKFVEKLNKVQIDAKSKGQIRYELNNFGINHRTMYPGLDGISKWVRDMTANFYWTALKGSAIRINLT